MRSLEDEDEENEFLYKLDDYVCLSYVVTNSELIDEKKIRLIKFINNNIKHLINCRNKELCEKEEASGCF